MSIIIYPADFNWIKYIQGIRRIKKIVIEAYHSAG